MPYRPKYFKAQELVPKNVFERNATGDIFAMFDENLLIDMDTIRELCVEEYGKGTYTIINNWHVDGQFSQRGLRTDPKVGAPNSPHRSGKAFDFDVYQVKNGKSIKVDAEKVRVLIRGNSDKLIAVRRMEKDVNWVHVDSVIHLFNP